RREGGIDVSAPRYAGSPFGTQGNFGTQFPVAAREARGLSKEGHRQLVNDVLRAGGRMWVRGGGASMLPTIRPGERVLLVPLCREPRVGDIVALRAGRCMLVHR